MTPALCLFCGGAVLPTGFACGNRPGLGIGRCQGCGLVRVMDFGHVSLDRYGDDQYFPEDTAPVWQREERWNLNRIARLRRELPRASQRKILDFGCGLGGFLKRAQGQFGSVVGFDLNRRMAEMHRAQGLTCARRLEDVPADVDTLVLFHVLEHTVKPWELLRGLIEKLPRVDRVVLEVPNTDEALLSLFGNAAYRSNHYSADHVYYFTNATLRAIAERAGLKVLVDSQLQRYALGNTFGWLAENRGGGQNKWPLFSADALHAAYEAALVEARVADSVFLICEPGGG